MTEVSWVRGFSWASGGRAHETTITVDPSGIISIGWPKRSRHVRLDEEARRELALALLATCGEPVPTTEET